MAKKDQEIFEKETGKLARLLSDEIDVALLEHGLATVNSFRSWDKLSTAERAAFDSVAKNVYLRLAYHTGEAYIMVIDHSRRAPDASRS